MFRPGPVFRSGLPRERPSRGARPVHVASRRGLPVAEGLHVGAVHAAHGGERRVDAAQVVGAQVLLDHLGRLVLVAAKPQGWVEGGGEGGAGRESMQ